MIPENIEVTALMAIADDAAPDVILREAEASRPPGVHAIVVRSTGPEPRAGSKRRGRP